MWRSNNQSSEQAVHSQGAFVVRDTLNFCKWGKWCIVMPWQSSWQNVGWVCLILLMPGCKHSVEEMEEKKEWWERRVDVRVHFLPFHSKVSVRTEREHVWRPPPRATVQTLTVHLTVQCGKGLVCRHTGTCLHSDLTIGGRRNAQNNLFLNKLRFPVVVSLVRLSQHIWYRRQHFPFPHFSPKSQNTRL